MDNIKIENGDIVITNIPGAPKMLVRDATNIGVELIYWNSKSGRIGEIGLKPTEVKVPEKLEVDYGKIYNRGDVVKLRLEKSPSMIVSEVENSNRQYLCRYYSDVTGSIEENLFYGFELKNGESEALDFFVF